VVARSSFLGLDSTGPPALLRLTGAFAVPSCALTPTAGPGGRAAAWAGLPGLWAPAARGPLVAINPVNPTEFATSSGSVLSTWSVADPAPLWSEAGSSSPITALAWVPQGAAAGVAMGSAHGSLKLVDPRALASATADCVRFSHSHAHASAVTAIAANPLVPHLLASASLDNEINIWDARFERCPVVRLTAHTRAPALSLAWSRSHPELLLSGHQVRCTQSHSPASIFLITLICRFHVDISSLIS